MRSHPVRLPGGAAPGRTPITAAVAVHGRMPPGVPAPPGCSRSGRPASGLSPGPTVSYPASSGWMRTARLWCAAACERNASADPPDQYRKRGFRVANIKSQIKRNKQNEKARQRNKAVGQGSPACASFCEAADAGSRRGCRSMRDACRSLTRWLARADPQEAGGEPQPAMPSAPNSSSRSRRSPSSVAGRHRCRRQSARRVEGCPARIRARLKVAKRRAPCARPRPPSGQPGLRPRPAAHDGPDATSSVTRARSSPPARHLCHCTEARAMPSGSHPRTAAAPGRSSTAAPTRQRVSHFPGLWRTADPAEQATLPSPLLISTGATPTASAQRSSSSASARRPSTARSATENPLASARPR